MGGVLCLCGDREPDVPDLDRAVAIDELVRRFDITMEPARRRRRLLPLNALQLGDDYARSLGVNLVLTRALVLSSAAVLAGTVTAFCGPIAFLGVAVPHLARAAIPTADHRLLMPATALAGAMLALAIDIVAKLPQEGGALPVNSVAGLVGAPVVAWIVLRRRRW